MEKESRQKKNSRCCGRMLRQISNGSLYGWESPKILFIILFYFSRDVFPLVVFVGFCLCRDDAIAAAVARCNRATVDASPMPPSSSTISFSRFQHSNILFVYTIVYLYHKHIIYNRATHCIAYFLLWVPFYMGYFMESRYSSITKVAHSSH